MGWSVARAGAVVVLGSWVAVSGCDMLKGGKGEDESSATTKPAETATATAADTATESAAPEAGGTSGIPECDRFLERYRCMLRNQSQSESAADEMADAWRKATTATERSTTANVCRQKARAMQGDFVRAGCESSTTTTDTCVLCAEDPLARGCCGTPRACSSDAGCGHGVCCLDPGGQTSYCFTRVPSCPSGWRHGGSLGKENQPCRPNNTCDTGLRCDTAKGKCVKSVRRVPVIR